MKKIIVALALLMSACGYSQLDSEMMGQVKKVSHRNPIICPTYYSVDVSLGVMRNGVGSLSTQDVWLTVEDARLLDTLKAANESGKLVKIKYDEYRVTFCIDEKVVKSVEIVE